MNAPHPVADALTPAERFEQALLGLSGSQRDAIRQAAAALVEECARTPRSQMDPLHMRRGDAS